MHEHQAGLCAHRHEGDGLHRVDPGDPEQDEEEEETHRVWPRCKRLVNYLE